MIEELLPAGTAAAESFDDPEGTPLFPEEEAVIAKAVLKRRREFTTARWCARRALHDLDVPPVPILPGERGEPRWPAGIVGSMTHCAGYRAAALARTATLATIGIDAEPAETLPDGVLGVISLPVERRQLGDLAISNPQIPWDRLLFSAKESVYKAWFPLARRFLGFSDAVVTIDTKVNSFTAKLLVEDTGAIDGTVLTGFTGRWLVRDGLIVTVITVPAA